MPWYYDRTFLGRVKLLMDKYLLQNLLICRLRPLRNKDFLLLQSSCSFLIGLCRSFDLLENSQILDLSVFVPRPFLWPKSLPLLSWSFSFHFNCSHQCIAKSFTQKLPLGEGFGYMVLEHAFRDAYSIRGTCPQEGDMHFSGHTCIYYIYSSKKKSFSGSSSR